MWAALFCLRRFFHKPCAKLRSIRTMRLNEWRKADSRACVRLLVPGNFGRIRSDAIELAEIAMRAANRHDCALSGRSARLVTRRDGYAKSPRRNKLAVGFSKIGEIARVASTIGFSQAARSCGGPKGWGVPGGGVEWRRECPTSLTCAQRHTHRVAVAYEACSCGCWSTSCVGERRTIFPVAKRVATSCWTDAWGHGSDSAGAYLSVASAWVRFTPRTAEDAASTATAVARANVEGCAEHSPASVPATISTGSTCLRHGAWSDAWGAGCDSLCADSSVASACALCYAVARRRRRASTAARHAF